MQQDNLQILSLFNTPLCESAFHPASRIFLLVALSKQCLPGGPFCIGAFKKLPCWCVTLLLMLPLTLLAILLEKSGRTTVGKDLFKCIQRNTCHNSPLVEPQSGCSLLMWAGQRKHATCPPSIRLLVNPLRIRIIYVKN